MSQDVKVIQVSNESLLYSLEKYGLATLAPDNEIKLMIGEEVVIEPRLDPDNYFITIVAATQIPDSGIRSYVVALKGEWFGFGEINQLVAEVFAK